MAAAERKRPWYLALALLGALTLGTLGASTGWGRMLLYHGAVDATMEGAGIADEATRQEVVARAQDWLDALDAAKARGWPLAVASLVIGSAVLFFGVRTLGGSSGARTALVQLVIAQAGVNAADYYFMRAYWDAWHRFHVVNQAALAHPDTTLSQPRFGVALSGLVSALVVFGLTRRRTRQFLDSAAETAEER
jgi:hypothetical protein